MITNVSARFSDGVLTPLEPLDVEEGEEVMVSIEDASDSTPRDGIADGNSFEARGQAIYEQRIRSRVEGTAQGKVVVIDVESSDYEIDPDDASATARLTARRPGHLPPRCGLAIRQCFTWALGSRIGPNDHRECQPRTWRL